MRQSWTAEVLGECSIGADATSEQRWQSTQSMRLRLETKTVCLSASLQNAPVIKHAPNTATEPIYQRRCIDSCSDISARVICEAITSLDNNSARVRETRVAVDPRLQVEDTSVIVPSTKTQWSCRLQLGVASKVLT